MVSKRRLNDRVVQLRDDEALVSIPLDAFLSLSFVPSYGTEDEDSPAPGRHGYQREPIITRGRTIGRHYLANGMITPIIASVRHVDIEDAPTFLDAIRQEAWEALGATFSTPFAIIDGQHRRLGLEWAHTEVPEFNPDVPLVLMFGLDYAAEAEAFDVINTTQKGVGKTLVEITRHDITDVGTETYPQKIRYIAAHLARDEDSVWYGRVAFAGRGRTTFEGLRRSTQSMFPEELLNRIDDLDVAIELAKFYWNGVVESSEDAWNNAPIIGEDGNSIKVDYRIHDLVGTSALARLGKDVISSALDAEASDDTDTDETIMALTANLSSINWAKVEGNPIMNVPAGFSGQKAMYTLLYGAVYEPPRPERRRSRTRANAS